jgi:hypothetical protein
MKIFPALVLSWFSALSSCALDLPHDKIVFSDLNAKAGVEISCSTAGRLMASTITIEYRKESERLFAVGFDEAQDQTGYLSLSKDETCSMTSETPGHFGGGASSKYYHVAHQWIADSRQDTPVCISGVQGSGCLQGTAIIEYAPKDPAALGTQTALIVLVREAAGLRVASAFILPIAETQQFSGFSEIPFHNGSDTAESVPKHFNPVGQQLN